MKKHIWAICLTSALIAFTVFIALDTFVLSAAYNENATGMNTSLFSVRTETQNEDAQAPDETVQEQTAVSDESAYKDENISITLTEYERYGTKIYVADVTLASAAYLKTAFANDTYGKNVTEKTSVTAEENDAILAINGDYYGAQETGYVIRNGVVYRDTAKTAMEICCIYADGTMQIKNTADVTAQELVDEGVWQAFSFGPALVLDGEIAVSEGEEVGKAMASNPRTAIGVIDANHYVFVVSDGRTDESEGLSLSQLAAFMQSLGVKTAYNLDGGGSSTLWYQGSVINKPTTSGNSIRERSVSDIVYIG